MKTKLGDFGLGNRNDTWCRVTSEPRGGSDRGRALGEDRRRKPVRCGSWSSSARTTCSKARSPKPSCGPRSAG